MNDSSASPADIPAPIASKATAKDRGRLTSDAPTRLMHWGMALSVSGAYLSAESEHWRLLHTTLGYTALGMLVARMAWGFWGPRGARLYTPWQQRLRSGLRGLQKNLSLQSWQLPAHAITVFALMAVLLLTTATGITQAQDIDSEWLEELHEWLGNAMLMLMLAHVAWMVWGSVLRKRNLLMPMLTGRTPGPGADLVSRPRRGWAALLMVAVLAFWGWRYDQAAALRSGPTNEEAQSASSDGLSSPLKGMDNGAEADDEDDDGAHEDD